jgi:hypothetical protein
MARQFTIGRANAVKGMMNGGQQLAAGMHWPAPLGGLNTLDGLTLMPETDCVRLNNLLPTRYGLEVRPGTINKCVLIGGNTTTEIRSVMPFTDVSRDRTLGKDRVFAVTDQGIYDITTSTSNPTLMGIYNANVPGTLLSTGWGIKGGDAGWCSFVNFSTALEVGGAHYLIVCDLVNGYHYYDPDGGGAGIGRWYKMQLGNSGSGTLEGIDPTKLVQVCSWKGRLLFTEVDNSRGWYLTPGAISGTGASKPVSIDFGSRFVAGGFLKMITTWTVDGGASIDDYLVVLGSGGDVVIWDGISPADANFQIKGQWFLGEFPRGRRVADTFGGDLLILSANGIIPLSQLVQGLQDTNEAYTTRKVQGLVRERVKAQGRDWGWSVTFHPSYSNVVVNLPYDIETKRYSQLVFNTTQQAWMVQDGIPSLSWAPWQGKEFIGTNDGRVLQWTGPFDTVPDSLNSSTYIQQAIVFYLLTSFQDLGAPGKWKRLQFIRPIFVASQLPIYQAAARYDFDVEIPNAIAPPPATIGALWDVAKWDQAEWGGGLVTTQPTIGARGVGRFVAIALSGRADHVCSLVGFDLIGDTGGLL